MAAEAVEFARAQIVDLVSRRVLRVHDLRLAAIAHPIYQQGAR